MIKKKFAKGGAMLLSAALLATTILPNFPKLGTKMEAEAFQGATGVCVDKTGYSNNHFYHSADSYQDTMIDLNELTYGTAEYEAALAQNVATLRATFGSDENIMKIFWVGIATWLTGGIAQYGDITEVDYWFKKAKEQAYDSAAKGYFDANLVNGNFNFPAVSEADLGKLLHDGGATWNRLVAQAPLLQYLVYNLFDGENWQTTPQVMPQLSKVFLDSYKDWQTGETGAALWPEDATAHMIQIPDGVIPDKRMVQEAALDMEKNKEYIDGSGKGPTVSSSKNKKKYQIVVKAGFTNNARLQVWNDEANTWQQVYYPFLLDGGPTTINGWEIGYEVLTSGSEGAETSRYTFEWKGEGKPTSLTMYFTIMKGTAPSIEAKTFNSPVEFAATYMKINKCTACGGSPKQSPAVHQTHIAYRPDDTPNSLPCFRLGEDDPLPGEPEMHFCIFSHSEDFEANYNVQMNKYDYETGQPLQNALFELYERFDDAGEINTESDGPETLFEGPKEDHGSGYTTNPVIWDDFRFVTSMMTDENGNISFTIKKEYHYEKTFCDGHPKPVIPEDASEESAAAAEEWWQAMVDACEAKAEEMPGIHFHWLLDESGDGGEDGGGDEESEFALNEDDEDEDVGDGSEDEEGGDDTGCPGIEESFEKSGAKADRDATYEKFINLKYSYTWKEYQAKDGYIRHDTHVDDVPIEVITTNSSEAGAESEFAGEYSKDITINESVGLEYVDSDSEEDGGEEGEEESEEEEEEGFSLSWRSISPFMLEAHASEIHTPDEMEESDFFEDEEYDLASPSNANWRIFLTNHGTAYLSDPGAYAMALEDEGDVGDDSGEGGEGSADFEAVYEAAFVGEQVGGENVEPGPSNNYSHCNDEDGEGNSWRIYDHRTEGEIHFNKRDMNLLDQDAGEFDAYGIANADGTLEGAVYGLFAAENIDHPDQKTGTIYWKDDLVAVATTDRNGDGSFMVYTEAPGHTYDYESGSIVENAHASSAKGNLFGDNSETEWHVDDYTMDGEYKGGPTQRLYENNKDNNGNYWIGRPLILGNYYIKELSRSEGYELSVNGKLDAITNRGEDLETEIEDEKGTASVSTNLYIQGQETVGMPNEPFFETTSEGMVENGGYDIVIDKLPEGVEFYRHDRKLGETTQQVFDHFEYQEKKDEDGNTIYRKAEVPGIPKFDENGKPISKEEDAVYVMNNMRPVTLSELDENIVNDVLAEASADDLNHTFEMNTADSTFWFYFIKAQTEKVLRENGYNVPKGSAGNYSEQDLPVYSRGVREGEVDTYGVSGVRPMEIAQETVYGPQLVKLTLNKGLTNAQMINEILQYYADHPYYDFGGIDQVVINATTYDVYIYAHNYLRTGSLVVLGESDEDTLILKQLSFNPDDENFEPYYVYVPYTYEESEDSFGTFEDLKVTRSYGLTGVSAKLVPDVEIDGEGNLSKKTVKVYECYEVGETIYDENGDPIPEMERVPVFTDAQVEGYIWNWEKVEARYENGKYIIHVDLPFTDSYGNTYTDADELLTLEFKGVVPEDKHTLTEEDLKSLNTNLNHFSVGSEMSSGEYEVEIKKARAKIYRNYDEETETSEGTYVQQVELSYPSDIFTFQDGTELPGNGTILNPIKVMERPIRQKVKVVKDIQVMPDSETYMHDTYSDVHQENIEGKENDGLNTHVTDSLTKLLEGDDEDQSPAKIPGFRFKAYLKSNLERLYRNENGEIIWTDRNGNAYVPTPKDTNNDGNYDTFTLVSGTEEIDFPEEHIVSSGMRVSTNVQKLYTQVSHNTSSTTTGDNANNVWAEYDTPQGGDTSQVGELREDNTSLDGDNGEAVYTNGALYSYDGKNVNVRETDKINAEQNTGYTRLLETEVVLMEDGAGKTRNVETYNYEKFFDAMAAANTDKWDNDMFTTYDGDGMNNYPGQNWFETFDEQYQRDDRDPDHTLPNVDNEDEDGSTGGDRDTSFKPFQWIREQLFGATDESKNDYPATHDNDNLENEINTSEFAHINSEASDAVRQFAIKWYLDDEVAKLLINNGYDEDVAKNIIIDGTKITVNEKTGPIDYSEQIYDLALYNALKKTYNYIRPFYNYDLDTIYSVEWDSAVDGGSDNDVTTLSADTLNNKKSYYYGVSAYLPYGTYVVVEQQPYREDLDDFDNKNYKTDKPKEVVLPSVYEENGNETSPEILDDYYNYTSADSPEKLAEKYFIRFNEEWAPDKTEDQRPYVIRAHNNDGDFEVYKYGLDVDKLTAEIVYPDSSYDYDGFKITQEQFDPLKDYYNDPVVDTKINGGNPDSEYIADNDNPSKPTASGNPYPENAIEARYHYGSISENSGITDDVIYPNGPETDDNNPSGYYFKDDVKTMTGNQTAYEGKYASMLVPWSVVEPAEETSYDITNFTGYADMKMRNTFYTTKLRIEKLDSETGENIVHDDAIFSIYAASRYTSRDEIEDAARALSVSEQNEFLELTEVGDVKFYLQDTQITGSYEFLTAMGARDITPATKGRSAGVGELWTGIVSKGTPVCLEEEQIVMQDALGNKTGQFKVYATLNDIEMLDEDATSPDDKTYMDQNVGYVVTPQPLGAGVYVLVETKAPAGYVRSKPVAIEVYSDSVSYYANGLTNTKVDATIYQGNIINDK